MPDRVGVAGPERARSAPAAQFDAARPALGEGAIVSGPSRSGQRRGPGPPIGRSYRRNAGADESGPSPLRTAARLLQRAAAQLPRTMLLPRDGLADAVPLRLPPREPCYSLLLCVILVGPATRSARLRTQSPKLELGFGSRAVPSAFLWAARTASATSASASPVCHRRVASSSAPVRQGREILLAPRIGRDWRERTTDRR
jgi:hypothetical protein